MRLALLMLCAVTAIQTAWSGEIVRITTGEYPPWTSEKLKHGGFTNHVISEAFALEGYTVEFTFYPWKRAYAAAKTGEKYHATSYWYPGAERRADFYYSDPLQEDAIVFFHLKSNPQPEWKTFEDLSDRRIGANEGFTYTDGFWAASRAGILNVEVALSEEMNLRKLLKGRIDLFPTDPLVGRRTLLDKFGLEAAESVTYHPRPLTAATGHLLISKKTENAREMLAAFNRGLAELKASGRYALFQDEWIAGKYD